MKLDAVRKSVNIESSADEKIDYGIDTSQMWLLYNILSQYSNPIGSIVRELSTNAVDSHIESDVQRRIGVRINNDNPFTGKRAAFEVEDFGTGISPDRIKNIYSKFLASSKRESNKEHGAYGLGSKSPFSYTDMFYTITRYNGYEYFYAMHKGEDCPRIELLDKQSTSEPNGTIVNVGIKLGDTAKFKREVHRQLAYFDNVQHEGTDVDNDYRIIRGEHFIYREHASDLGLTDMHVCLGKVYYPLDFNAVSLKSMKKDLYSSSNQIKTPIGLKFEIGELPIVWSRENIEYTNDAIQTIQDKYELAKEELQDTYDDIADDVETVKDYFFVNNNMKDNELEIVDGVKITNIDHMVDLSLDLEPYKELPKYPDPYAVLNLIYKVHKEVKKGSAHKPGDTYKASITRLKGSYGTVIQNDRLKLSGPAYLVNTKYNTRKNKYLYMEVGHSFFRLVSKRSQSEKPSEADILSTFGIKEVTFDATPDDIVSLVKKYSMECIKMFKESIESYEDVDVPDDFNPGSLKTVRDDMFDTSSDNYDPNLKIHFKSVARNDIYHGESIKGFTVWEPTIGELIKYRSQLRIYGFQEDSDLLEATGSFFYDFMGNHHWDFRTNQPKTREFQIIKIAKGKEDVLLDLSDNAMHVSEFYSRRHQILVRELTAYYIRNTLEDEGFKISKIHSKELKLLKDLGLKEAYEAITEGRDLVKQCDRRPRTMSMQRVPSEIITMLESPAFLNKTMIDTYKLAHAYLEKFPLLYSIIKEEQPEEQLELLKEELKFYLKGKDKIHPLLTKRLERKKENQGKDKLDILLSSLNTQQSL